MLQLGEILQEGEIAALEILNGQGFQAGEVAEVRQAGHILRDSQLGDRPEGVGHNRIVLSQLEELADIGVQGAVLQSHRLYDAADGVRGVHSGADQAVVADAKGNGGGLPGGQLDGGRIGVVFQRGEAAVDGEVRRAGACFQADGDILGIIAALRRQDWGVRPGFRQLCADGFIFHPVQQLRGVQQLVLRDVGFGEGQIELQLLRHRGDGVDQRVLRLGVVIRVRVGAGEADGQIRVRVVQLPGPAVVAQGRRIMLARHGRVTPALQEV